MRRRLPRIYNEDASTCEKGLRLMIAETRKTVKIASSRGAKRNGREVMMKLALLRAERAAFLDKEDVYE